MLGSFKPVAFEPYGRRRRRSVPRWLLVLLAGAALGAGGVLLVQQRYLPPPLPADEAAGLRQSLEQTEAERLRLQHEVADTTQQLDASVADAQALAEQIEAGAASTARLRADLASALALLPPDPRGGAVEVRAARFTSEGGSLAYDVVLSRKAGGSAPLRGVMQFVVAGEAARGARATVTLPPIAISVEQFEGLRGSLPLPEGFKPLRVTLDVLDREGGSRLGLRVVNVR